ncbi:MAG TPA: DMT family transporter [Candidatus Eisenbacteria bacterium]|nr:DMT family transporter [Candidatus Eisenbacteria bacterium]
MDAPHGSARIALLTALAMVAFAGNSILCRVALRQTTIDAATFTSVRILAGAVALAIVVRLRHGSLASAGNWGSAIALFVYAAGFSFAYLSLSAGTGALLLFGAVQMTMIVIGLRSGERLHGRQWIGLALALAGLVGLVLPGVTAPPLAGSLLMLSAGAAWGVYSIRGRGQRDPIRVTAGNFLLATPIAALLSLAGWRAASWDSAGVGYAIVSGALTSGIGYAIWYTALPGLRATSAAAVQLSVPVLAALGGVVLLGETVTPRLALTAAAVLSGIAMVVTARGRGTNR